MHEPNIRSACMQTSIKSSHARCLATVLAYQREQWRSKSHGPKPVKNTNHWASSWLISHRCSPRTTIRSQSTILSKRSWSLWAQILKRKKLHEGHLSLTNHPEKSLNQRMMSHRTIWKTPRLSSKRLSLKESWSLCVWEMGTGNNTANGWGTWLGKLN